MNIATVFYAILLFGFLIFVHEIGHFIMAKIWNIKVLKFSLGFGPKLLGKKIGETEYLFSSIPLGGYVKIFGESKDNEDLEIKPEDEKRSFKNQPIYKRVSIVFLGPFFNLLTAVIIFIFIYLSGVPTLLPVIGEVLPNSPAQKNNILKGDKIIEINSIPIKIWTDMTELIYANSDKPLKMKIQRNNETFVITIIPEGKAIKDLFGEVKTIGIIGVKPSGDEIFIRQNLIDSFKMAFVRTWEISHLTITGIVKMFQRIVPIDTIGGPILIFQIAEKQASAGAINFFAFAAVISINLGLLNLFPIPILDGGHLLFMGIEAIRRKPLSENTMEIFNKIGIAMLVGLMALAFYNDLFRIFSNQAMP